MKHTIRVTEIKVYAYHGCLEEEGTIGCDYEVDVIMNVDFSEAAKTDDLKLTIDYVSINKIVKEEMAIRSKLIEHAGQRMVDRIKGEFPQIERLEVTVKKLNPPINGNVRDVSISIID